MKALRIKIVKDFMNRKKGEILPSRRDIGNDLVNQGLAEWVLVDIKDEHEKPEIVKPIEVIKTPEVKIEEITITEKVETTEPISIRVDGKKIADLIVKEKKKRTRKPKAEENKEFNPKLENK